MYQGILKKLYILLFFLMSPGCGSHFMFTYSDKSSENYLEDQRQNAPWEPDSAELQLQSKKAENAVLENRLTGKVKEVIDVKTILLESGDIVEYIGVDAVGKSNNFFEDAKNFNRLLVDGKYVKLQFDIQGRTPDGNLFAYVFTEGIFVNGEIIKHGYAKFVPHPQNIKYQELFTIYEAEAIKRKKGIWGK